MRKKIALAITAVMLVAGFTGCSEEGGGSSAEKKDEITLTFGSHQSGIPSCGVLDVYKRQIRNLAWSACLDWTKKVMNGHMRKIYPVNTKERIVRI